MDPLEIANFDRKVRQKCESFFDVENTNSVVSQIVSLKNSVTDLPKDEISKKMSKILKKESFFDFVTDGDFLKNSRSENVAQVLETLAQAKEALNFHPASTANSGSQEEVLYAKILLVSKFMKHLLEAKKAQEKTNYDAIGQENGVNLYQNFYDKQEKLQKSEDDLENSTEYKRHPLLSRVLSRISKNSASPELLEDQKKFDTLKANVKNALKERDDAKKSIDKTRETKNFKDTIKKANGDVKNFAEQIKDALKTALKKAEKIPEMAFKNLKKGTQKHGLTHDLKEAIDKLPKSAASLSQEEIKHAQASKPKQQQHSR